MFDYTEEGVRVSPNTVPKADEPIITAGQMILMQYLGTTEATKSDVDLLARNDFEHIFKFAAKKVRQNRLRSRDYASDTQSATAIGLPSSFASNLIT